MAKFEKAVKAADNLGDTIANTTDKIMEMRKDIDGKQVIELQQVQYPLRSCERCITIVFRWC